MELVDEELIVHNDHGDDHDDRHDYGHDHDHDQRMRVILILRITILASLS